MALIVFVVGEQEEDVDELVIVVDGGDQAVMILDVENGHGPSAGHLDLVGGRQDPAERDQVIKVAPGDQRGPMSEGAGSGRMQLGEFSKAFDGDDPHLIQNVAILATKQDDSPIQIPSRRDEPFRDTRGPGEESVAKMIATLGKTDSPKARRDQAILRLLFDLGLRRESIVSLDLQHWSDETTTLQVMLKAHSQRMPKRLPPVTSDALKKWIEVRGTQDGPLFVRIDRGDHCDPTGSPEMAFTT